MDTEQTPRARVVVFGECADQDAAAAARRVTERLSRLGYEPVLLGGPPPDGNVRCHIFKPLEESEYFVWLDLAPRGGVPAAWSLAAREALAVAAYLALPTLVLREECGAAAAPPALVAPPPVTLTAPHRDHLPDLLEEHLAALPGWNPRWKRGLEIESGVTRTVDRLTAQGAAARVFHLGVRNRHPHRAATHCCAYLEQARWSRDSEPLFDEMTDLAWCGTGQVAAAIGPNSRRFFEALMVVHERPDFAYLGGYAGEPGLRPHVRGPGRVRLAFAVTADGLPTVRREFDLCIGQRLTQVSLDAADDAAGQAAERPS
jgi:hypothetical protein